LTTKPAYKRKKKDKNQLLKLKRNSKKKGQLKILFKIPEFLLWFQLQGSLELLFVIGTFPSEPHKDCLAASMQQHDHQYARAVYNILYINVI